MDLAHFIGTSIKTHRKAEKLTQQQLAQKIGRTESSIRKYEGGLTQIPLDVIEAIAEALNTTA